MLLPVQSIIARLSLLLALGCGILAQAQPTAPAGAGPTGAAQVQRLSRLTRELRTTNTVQSIRYGQQGLRLAQQLQDSLGEVEMLTELGTAYFVQEKFPAATQYYQQAVARAERVPRAGRLLALALLNLGRVAVSQHDYAEAQRYFSQSRRRMQQLHPAQPQDLGIVENSLGVLYMQWLNSGHAPDSARHLALQYNRLAVRSFRQYRAASRLAPSLNTLGLVHQLLGRPDSAEYYHRAALHLLEQLNQPNDLAQTRVWLGAALVARHRAAQALPLLRLALASARQLRLPGLRADCLLQLADALAETGQGLAAYRLALQGQRLLDSMQLVAQQTDLTRLRVSFDTEREHSRAEALALRSGQQYQQAQRQRQRLWWLGGLLAAVAAGLLATSWLALRLRQQQGELARQHAEQDRLYALIAHDLRSPVLAFGALADLLTSHAAHPDAARLLGLAGRVRQAADSLRELLDNLLHWALAQRGEMVPVPEALAVADLLAEASRLYRAAAEAGGVGLHVSAPAAAWVWADHQMTLVILRNLVSNALRATPVGGQLRLHATPAGSGQYCLTVTDTGCGMTETELAEVLADGPPTGRRSGLGLRLSRHFARLQGGALTLRSEFGQGTTATLLLTQAMAPDPLLRPAWPLAPG